MQFYTILPYFQWALRIKGLIPIGNSNAMSCSVLSELHIDILERAFQNVYCEIRLKMHLGISCTSKRKKKPRLRTRGILSGVRLMEHMAKGHFKCAYRHLLNVYKPCPATEIPELQMFWGHRKTGKHCLIQHNKSIFFRHMLLVPASLVQQSFPVRYLTQLPAALLPDCCSHWTRFLCHPFYPPTNLLSTTTFLTCKKQNSVQDTCKSLTYTVE